MSIQQNLPSYNQIFGKEDIKKGDDSRSVLSPAAYFVDLMLLKENEIDVDAAESIDERRADLGAIPLDYENTYSELPYLDIVNEVMANRIHKETGSNAFDALKTAQYPFPAPFDIDNHELHHILAYHGTSLTEFYKMFTATPDMNVIAKTYLGITDAVYQQLITADTTDASLRARYGLAADQNPVDVLSDLTKFMKRTGLSEAQVKDLLFQNLSDKEVEANNANDFFINQGQTKYITIKSDSSIIVADSVDVKATAAFFDKVQRFVFLSRITGWSFTECDLVIRKTCGNAINESALRNIATVIHLQKQFKLPIDQLCVLWSDIKNWGEGRSSTPENLFYQTFDKNADISLLEEANLSIEQPNIKKRVQAGLGLSESDLDLLIQKLSINPDLLFSGDPSKNMTLENLSTLYRFSELSKMFKLSITDMITIIDIIDDHEIDFSDLFFPVTKSASYTTGFDALCNPLTNDSERISWIIFTIEKMAQKLKKANLTPKEVAFITATEITEKDCAILGEKRLSEFISDIKSRINPELVTPELFKSFIIDEPTAVTICAELKQKDPGINCLTTEGMIVRVPVEGDFESTNLSLDQDGITEVITKLTDQYAAQNELLKNRKESVYEAFADYFEIDSKVTQVIVEKLIISELETYYDSLLKTIAIPLFSEHTFDKEHVTKTFNILQQLLLVVKRMGLSEKELTVYFRQNRMIRRTKGVGMEELDELYNIRALNNSFNNQDNPILDYIEQELANDNALCLTTDWDEVQLTKLKGCGFGELDNLQTLMKLKERMDYCNRLQSTATILIDNGWQKVFGASKDIKSANDILINNIKATSSKKTWDTISQEMHDQMNLAKRNAMLPYLMNLLGMKDARELYADLLLDVEMGEEATISRIKEAISAAQLYCHRTLNNLESWEASKTKLDNLKRWWGWMKNYRVWEANRKVFLYPENYIRPELRIDKSPSFKALEEELLQAEISDDSVQRAYKKYLDQYAEVSNLVIAGGCVFRKDDGIHAAMFGHTRTEPMKYYYRMGKVWNDSETSIDWEPWNPLDVAIHSDRVYPVYAFNRLFVFWRELRDVNTSEFATDANDNVAVTEKTIYNPVVHYSFFNLNKEWVAPQILLDGEKESGQNNPAWIKPAIEDAQLRVVNPSLSSEYDDQEYIYIRYSGCAGLNLFGRLTSELTYESMDVAQADSVLAINPVSTMPTELGIVPNSQIQWQSNFEDTCSVPWFSFDSKGGSFLCKPNKFPEISNEDIGLGTPFSEISSVYSGFKANDGNTYVFHGQNYSVYNDSFEIVQSAQSIKSRWEKTNLFENVGENIKYAFVLNGITHFFTPSHWIYYLSSDYSRYSAKRNENEFDIYGHLASRTPLSLTGNYVDGIFGIESAFVYDGKLYIVTAAHYVELDISQYYPSWTSVDSAIYDGTQVSIFSGNEVMHTALIIDGIVGRLWFNFNTTKYNITGFPQRFGQLTEIKATFKATNDVYYYFSDSGYVNSNDLSIKSLNDWGNATNLLSNGVDAAFQDDQGRIYLFSGYNYLQFESKEAEFPTDMEEKTTSDKWVGTPFLDSIFKIGNKVITSFPSGSGDYEYNVYTEDGNSGFVRQNSSSKVLKGNWSNLPGHFNNRIQAAFYVGDDLYIFHSTGTVATYVRYDADASDKWPFELEDLDYQIIRLTSNTAQKMSKKLFAQGISGLMELASQQEDELPKFESYAGELPATQAVDTIYYKSDIISSVPASHELDFDSANGNYYWEVFFHVPYLVAQTLNVSQKHDLAQDWYHYVYDPTARTTSVAVTYTVELKAFLNSSAYIEKYKYDKSRGYLVLTGAMLDPEKDALNGCFDNSDNKEDDLEAIENLYNNSNSNYYWKFLPFHEKITEVPEKSVAQFDRYFNNPFDPHAIAELRPLAYRKAMVMSYIDNLLDWGDKLFAQYTHESINEARMLYILAYDLLGERPRIIEGETALPTQNYHQLYTEVFPATWNTVLENLEISQETVDMLDMVPTAALTLNDNFVAQGYFEIPENDLFVKYWDRVEDRLFKIRNSMNIEGVKTSLALFQAPIDPMALVQAVSAAGGNLAQALDGPVVETPHYRFNTILAKTREFTNHVMQLGQNLLSAFEKKDAEEMSLLRNTQESSILKNTLKVKEEQIESAARSLEALQSSIKNAEKRYDHYNKLLDDGLSGYETTQVAMLFASKLYSFTAQVLNAGGSIAKLIPNLGSPFAITFGGVQLGDSADQSAKATQAIADAFGFAANMSSLFGGWHRREQDWKLQEKLAANDKEHIAKQIEAARIQVAIAEKEKETSLEQIKNNQDIDTFLKNKFTNKELYQWMVSKITGVYFQTYKMALELATMTQKAFQFELGLKEADVNYVNPVYWDSLNKGLLAGEQLQKDLDRMEMAYMDKNKRRFEISKSVSLMDLDPMALINLKKKGECTFDLTERLFDLDFPGHYCRQIKTISVSFPAIVGKYQNLNATLTQDVYKTLMVDDLFGVKELLGVTGGSDKNIRSDLRKKQQIALSRGENDAGLFQLNYHDERYLPFEGTGAVSTWTLELNGVKGAIDWSQIQDVIINVEYTALQGGQAFADQVEALVEGQNNSHVGGGLILIKQAFSDAWNQFMQNPAGGLSFTIDAEHCPNINESKSISEVYLQYDLTETGVTNAANVPLKLNGTPLTENDWTSPAGLVVDSTWNIELVNPTTDDVKVTPENIRNIALVVKYTTAVSYPAPPQA